jgi:multiple sugar transport system substrate-binding protein
MVHTYMTNSVGRDFAAGARRRRRFLAGVGLLSTLAIVVTGCSSSSHKAAAGTSSATSGSAAAQPSGAASAGGATVHLVMWQQWGGGHQQVALDDAIKQYETLHPNISITETPVTNNAKILAAITGGNPPDIVDLGTSLPLGGWAAQGAIQPLDDLISSTKLDTSVYDQTGLDGLKLDGKTYALPFQLFDIALLYNKKLFQAAGLQPPTTIEQLTADAAQLTKTDSAGNITQLGFAPDYPGPDQGQVCPLESYGWLYGGNWVDSTGKPTPADPANVAALTWEQSLYKQFGPQKVSNFLHSAGAYLTAGDPFESGKLAMMFDGPWSEQYARDNNPALAAQVGVVKFPAPASMPANTGTTFLDSNPQLIPKGSKHVNEAFAFISWLTTNAQVTAQFSDIVANVPQLTTVPAFKLQQDPLFELYVDEANSPQAHVWPQSATSTTYGTLLCQAQESALLDGKDPQTALQSVASALAKQ